MKFYRCIQYYKLFIFISLIIMVGALLINLQIVSPFQSLYGGSLWAFVSQTGSVLNILFHFFCCLFLISFYLFILFINYYYFFIIIIILSVISRLVVRVVAPAHHENTPI